MPLGLTAVNVRGPHSGMEPPQSPTAGLAVVWVEAEASPTTRRCGIPAVPVPALSQLSCPLPNSRGALPRSVIPVAALLWYDQRSEAVPLTESTMHGDCELLDVLGKVR